jgi:hypothetical protein
MQMKTKFLVVFAALFLGGCLDFFGGSSVDPQYSENAIRGMLAHGSNAPAPTDLPKVGDSDWCARVKLVRDNANMPPAIKSQYSDFGRTKGCPA